MMGFSLKFIAYTMNLQKCVLTRVQHTQKKKDICMNLRMSIKSIDMLSSFLDLFFLVRSRFLLLSLHVFISTRVIE